MVLWTTVESNEQAEMLARGLLEQRLAACVQIDSPITSHYVWKGQTCSETELRVVVKTLASKVDEAMTWLAENHPYDEPQLVVLPVAKASSGYARWVAESTSK
ncbi:divalent-cation tolerance protein CutA [Rhodopirellula sp. JC740]|uniref:Divalent-cation tolerance protein CutA n=1 Tax=Rhodopirellula halodulae TaxID=2894198 RepID=A0ABS8NDZ6_9BACT|nr:divalent-cation tolerance protein CutA [Rhodopirellula sp. JC740]MCC9641777.1 divalent-cation tolerance protein CutA [Rhodopirellula sp. JC740]